MKRKHSSKCLTCSGQLARKKSPSKPYGTKGTNPYCYKCDMDYVYDVSKSSERMKSKKKIRRELEDI
jgi:hypothetical protein